MAIWQGVHRGESDRPHSLHDETRMNFARNFFLAALMASGGSAWAAAHQHINAGAVGGAGAHLQFLNGAGFVASSGYVLLLSEAARTSGPHQGWHTGSISFTALPGTVDTGGPAFGHAAAGAHLELAIRAVEGPAGGSIGFWEADGDSEGTTLTFATPVGTVNGAGQFPLSENVGEPGADPYGHVHGRIFSADVPGLYRVSFQIVDTSQNGPGGGPLHPPSDLYSMWFQAGITIASVARHAGVTTLKAVTRRGGSYVVEGTRALGPEARWEVVVGPVTGTDWLDTFTHQSGEESWYYRLRIN